MNRHTTSSMAIAIACLTLLIAGDALAFRMIQTTYAGRTSSGARVECDAPGGFVHWSDAGITWRLNPAGQAGAAGVLPALESAMSRWSDASPAGHDLHYGGTTAAGFTTDGVNTILWAGGNGCTGGCLALTALVLGPGQVIQEADISFNAAASWSTAGADYDVEAIAAHELGHALGVHHTELTAKKNRPTMYAAYFGVDGRTLEQDDRDAIRCSCERYPPAAGTTSVLPGVSAGSDRESANLRLASRARPGRAVLRYGLDVERPVRLEIFDVAGRRLATLVNGVRSAGEHEVSWDGTGDGGRARSGVYFARLTAIRETAGATVILAR